MGSPVCPKYNTLHCAISYIITSHSVVTLQTRTSLAPQPQHSGVAVAKIYGRQKLVAV